MIFGFILLVDRENCVVKGIVKVGFYFIRVSRRFYDGSKVLFWVGGRRGLFIFLGVGEIRDVYCYFFFLV